MRSQKIGSKHGRMLRHEVCLAVITNTSDNESCKTSLILRRSSVSTVKEVWKMPVRWVIVQSTHDVEHEDLTEIRLYYQKT